MSAFEVWAPYARRVELLLRGERTPMQATSDGWFGTTVSDPGNGSYNFVVDGDPLPDPRSRWQPDGVHGPSKLVDHHAFSWNDRDWRGVRLADQIVYELHVGTFTPEGSFDSAAGRLDHVVDLGVTAVEVMPVAQFPGARGWGYDGVDLYAPQQSYGGPEGLKRFVDACHRRGLAAILDVVYNHLGPDGNYLGRYGPYFTERYATPWGSALNLDGADSGPVRRFFIENALTWLRDYHFDGLRLDAVHAIVDSSALHILEELAIEVAHLQTELGRELFLIAESDLNDPRIVQRRELGGYGIDAQWSDDFHHALHALLTGERDGYYVDFGAVEDVAKAWNSAFVYDGRYSTYRRRTHGRAVPVDVQGGRFLGYMQNHDQIGNRAKGDRSSALLSTELLKVAAALVFTSPFIPMLFQGEEWGARSPFLYFTDHESPELGRTVSEGRKREFATFGWDPGEIPDPQAAATFERSKLDWRELQRSPHRELLDWHKQLIRLRKDQRQLFDDRLHTATWATDDKRWLVLRRGALSVACNFSGDVVDIDLDEPLGDIQLASAEVPVLTAGSARLTPESVAICAR